MRRSSAALVTLVLLLGCGEASEATTNHTYCEKLANLTATRFPEFDRRSVSQNGRPTTVTLVWGSEPAHAAAALLAAGLRHVRRYDGVLLPAKPSPYTTAALAASLPLSNTADYTDLVIGVSTAWEPVQRAWEPSQGPWPGLAGPRLSEFGASSVAARHRLFSWLPPHARTCQSHVRWSFYADRTALAGCYFVDEADSKNTTVNVLAVGNCMETLQQLQERASATNTSLNVRTVGRAEFVHTLSTANHSFLFLDYDMWEGAEGVSVVEPPPCKSVNFHCKLELDSTIAMRVADVDILQVYAPHLFQYVHDFKPSPLSLRTILERQANGVQIEEAACQWALDKKKYAIRRAERIKYDQYKYTVLAYLCYDDPGNLQYDEIIISLGKLISYTYKDRCDIIIRRFFMYCSDEYSMSNRLNNFTQSSDFYNLVGVVSMAVKGAAAASATAAGARVPLLLADVAPEADSGAATTWRVAGRPRHGALALRHLVRQSGWTRVAVLSHDTKLADDYSTALKDEEDIIFREFPIPPSLTKQKVQEVLQNLRDINARIVFVNTDSQVAVTILNAADAEGMGYSKGFVWIVRDWQQNITVSGTKYFAVSFWYRGLEDVSLTEDGEPVREMLQGLTKTQKLEDPWAPHAVSLVDALLSLTLGFKDVFRRHPNTRQDLHSGQMIQALQKNLIENPVTGVSQRLHYAERSIEETLVFVDLWCGGRFDRRLATWRVNASSGAVRGNYSQPSDLPRDDGASSCKVRSGDDFDPTCYDVPCACALLLLALAPGAVLYARRALSNRLKRMQHEQQIQAIARRQHVATVLAAYLVERAALQLREELGAGRFGSVCLARLQQPGRAPRYIAAKALRDNAAPAEESEFLREACTIASLEHAHIVRLVGVCIADGPPLVLMELAFFGDLLGYLRERRHLVEDTGSVEQEPNGEAEHVSAEALTRLAREAAQALQYLGTRGVVHRDVRAANCLVDVRRSLKLADFGMARDTVASADGSSEYACRRRGLFPVLWMAPESLAHGVFSAASDMWALGVLLLELVTLGARPYGSMSPLRVLEYVAAGGSPPLPLDATPQTRGLARLCCARVAERRPSAAQVAAYLAAWPHALSPALLTERDEPADADSGYGDSPSTELLPPDSSPHSFDQLEPFAATQ